MDSDMNAPTDSHKKDKYVKGDSVYYRDGGQSQASMTFPLFNVIQVNGNKAWLKAQQVAATATSTRYVVVPWAAILLDQPLSLQQIKIASKSKTITKSKDWIRMRGGK